MQPATALDLLDYDSLDELQAAIWQQDDHLIDVLSGPGRTALAKAIDWSDFDFDGTVYEESIRTYNAVPLETCNNTTLAVLGQDGTVYQIGDRVSFTTTQSSRRGWGSGKKKEYTIDDRRLTYLSPRNLVVGRFPTYSNTSGADSYKAVPGDTDIDRHEQSSLVRYRARLTEGTAIKSEIPEEVNGWKLEDVTTRGDEKYLQGNLVTGIKWRLNPSACVSASWRSSFNCWRLSTPVRGHLTDNNDDYLYEIDIPQNVITLDELLEYAVEAMNHPKLAPKNIQMPYDLRKHTADEPKKARYRFVPTPVPQAVGDWELEDESPNWIRYVNHNPNSVWENFHAKIDSKGGVTVSHRSEDNDISAHASRKVEHSFVFS